MTRAPIADVLRAYRQKHDVTVREFAKMTGISAATVSRIERGHACDGLTIVKLFRWLFEGGSR